MPIAFNIVLRFIWYLFSRLLIWAVAIGLVILSFFMAMDYMNVNILTKDGFQERAAVIIEGDEPTMLSKVFSKGFLEQDSLLNSDIYQQYNVSDYDYSSTIGFSLVYPWQDNVTLQVTEEVTNIDAEVYAATETEAVAVVPQWINAIYKVTLVRYEDNWRIVSMDTIELLPTPTASPSSSSHIIED